MQHYLIARAEKLVAVAHATSSAQARTLADGAGFTGCQIHHNDPAQGYTPSTATAPKVERF